MTSIHSSPQTFDKADWVQQKIKEVQEWYSTANSGEAENKQRAEVCRRTVGALGVIAMRPSESLTLYTASCTLCGLALSSAVGGPHRVSLPKRVFALFARSAAWRSSLPKKMTLIP